MLTAEIQEKYLLLFLDFDLFCNWFWKFFLFFLFSSVAEAVDFVIINSKLLRTFLITFLSSFIYFFPASGKKHPTSGESCGSLCNDVAAAAAAKSLQSCPTLCDPTDGSPPGSAVPGILQARTLEWVAVSFSVAKMLEHL